MTIERIPATPWVRPGGLPEALPGVLPWAPEDGVDLVIPVKHRRRAKTRLPAPVGVDHAALALAMALDTVAAAARCEGVRVFVVTDDERLPALLPPNVVVVPDSGGGLNGAIRAGLQAAALAGPRAAQATIPADLPALRTTELHAALTAIGCRGAGFVPDARELGTVLLAGRQVQPHFGERSAASHREAGYPQVLIEAPGLRWDADDEEALAYCRSIGVGRHTRAVLQDPGADR